MVAAALAVCLSVSGCPDCVQVLLSLHNIDGLDDWSNGLGSCSSTKPFPSGSTPGSVVGASVVRGNAKIVHLCGGMVSTKVTLCLSCIDSLYGPLYQCCQAFCYCVITSMSQL